MDTGATAMTLQRQEVEELLDRCNETIVGGMGWTVARLCRAWLAVNSAPVMTTDGYSLWEGHPDDTQIEWELKRVRLVVEE